jgi:hypothetical protein
VIISTASDLPNQFDPLSQMTWPYCPACLNASCANGAITISQRNAGDFNNRLKPCVISSAIRFTVLIKLS